MARSRVRQVIAGLDVGTTKICCVIADWSPVGNLDIVGVGTSPSRGLRKGVVVNIDSTVESIKHAVAEAEEMAGVEIPSVIAGVAGGHIRGINSRAELAEVTAMVRQQKNEELMAAGVTLIDPATTYVDSAVVVGPDTVLHPCVILEGSTRIGVACEIHAGARIVNSTIGDRVLVRNHTIIADSTVEPGAQLGPFAHIRPGSSIGESAHIGNFVELKKTRIGKGAKANHLAYLGDATIGAKTNVGAGTITCNYDGEKKHQTMIGDNVFVGSNSTLVAPVAIGDGSYIAAGSAITDDVQPGALGIGRARQENKDGWVAKRAGAKKL